MRAESVPLFRCLLATKEKEAMQRKVERMDGQQKNQNTSLLVLLEPRVTQMTSRLRPFSSPHWKEALQGDVMKYDLSARVLGNLRKCRPAVEDKTLAMHFHPAHFRLLHEKEFID